MCHIHLSIENEKISIGFDVSIATWKREFKLPWREAGAPNHHDDKVDSDQ